MSLSSFKKAFEHKLLYGWGLLCEKVSVVPVRANNKNYKFLRLDGNHGKKGPPPYRTDPIFRLYPLAKFA